MKNLNTIKYSIFNRHDNMTEDTRSEILSIINAVEFNNEVQHETSMSLQNKLYGLFDGYLYDNLLVESKDLSLDLLKRVTLVFRTCKAYPKMQIIN